MQQNIALLELDITIGCLYFTLPKNSRVGGAGIDTAAPPPPNFFPGHGRKQLKEGDKGKKISAVVQIK